MTIYTSFGDVYKDLAVDITDEQIKTLVQKDYFNPKILRREENKIYVLS